MKNETKKSTRFSRNAEKPLTRIELFKPNSMMFVIRFSKIRPGYNTLCVTQCIIKLINYYLVTRFQYNQKCIMFSHVQTIGQFELFFFGNKTFETKKLDHR